MCASLPTDAGTIAVDSEALGTSTVDTPTPISVVRPGEVLPGIGKEVHSDIWPHLYLCGKVVVKLVEPIRCDII